MQQNYDDDDDDDNNEHQKEYKYDGGIQCDFDRIELSVHKHKLMHMNEQTANP